MLKLCPIFQQWNVLGWFAERIVEMDEPDWQLKLVTTVNIQNDQEIGIFVVRNHYKEVQVVTSTMYGTTCCDVTHS
jgi:hypothetical protein